MRVAVARTARDRSTRELISFPEEEVALGRPAVFLDRDGVLVPDQGAASGLAIEPYSYAAEAVRRLGAAGFVAVVVSNQAIVARGWATEDDVRRAHDHLQERLAAAGGGGVERFYFCPHHPNATLPSYRMACLCRKPGTALIERAARELDLDLGASYLVGDRPSDILAGRRAGCRTVWVQTGMHDRPPIEGPDLSDAVPHHVCRDLAAAADLILGESG